VRLRLLQCEHRGHAGIRLREALHEQAIRDPLTRLLNRRYLAETLPRELHRAGREALVSEYLAAIGKSFGWRYRLPFLLYDAKVRLKRRIGRKAIRRWLDALRARKRERPEG